MRIVTRYVFQSYSQSWGYIASVENGPQNLVFRTTEPDAIEACREYVSRTRPELTLEVTP